MALKRCRECGHEVSDEAAICLNCGCGNPAHPKKTGWPSVIAFVLFLVIVYELLRHLKII